ncbi:hypothetical protein ACA910_012140 [Epithemia clementina (nom. ined.)]
MTNKNKRTKPRPTSKNDSAAAKNAAVATTTTSAFPAMESTPKGILTRGQLTALIFLGMGIARLFQVGDAIRKEESVMMNMGNQSSLEEEASNNNNTTMPTTISLQASQTCLHFFKDTGDGEEWTPETTCLEDGFNALLKYKYALGWQVAALVAAMILQCWHVEAWLMRFNVGLVILSPIFPSVLLLLMAVPTLLSKASIWPHVIMALVLSYLGSPTSVDWIPFVTGRRGLAAALGIPPRHDPKSVQSLMLLACASLFFVQGVVHWGIPLVPSVVMDLQSSNNSHSSNINNNNNPENVMSTMASVMSWINQELLTSATQTPSSLVVVLLLIVDKLTMALVYIFGWFYLPEQHQRTLLLYTGVIFFCAATYQWTWLDGQIANADMLRAVDWTLAGCGIVTWIAPSLVAKPTTTTRSTTTNAATTTTLVDRRSTTKAHKD